MRTDDRPYGHPDDDWPEGYRNDGRPYGYRDERNSYGYRDDVSSYGYRDDVRPQEYRDQYRDARPYGDDNRSCGYRDDNRSYGYRDDGRPYEYQTPRRKPLRPPESPEQRKRRRTKRLIIIGVAAVVVMALAGVGALAVKRQIDYGTVRYQAVNVAVPKSWKLTFDQTFSGSKLDSKVWATCYPWATKQGCSNYGNTSDIELEWYKSTQVHVSNGALQLVAQPEKTLGHTKAGKPKEYSCRSGMVTTYPSLKFKYGYVQITAKLPFSTGLWEAFWLAAANKKWPPEVDILEHWATQSNSKAYLHPLTGARQGGWVSTPNLSAGWHTFTLYWSKTQLVWYYDGTETFASTTGVPQQDMYLVMNLADDVAGPGTCSGSVGIKSVKVWQPPN